MTTLSPESERRINNLNSLGLVELIDHAAGKCRVRIGDNLTDWLPWTGMRMGAVRIWAPPSIGEQVCVHSETGELETGYVTVSLPTVSHPKPSSDPNTIEIHAGAMRLILNHRDNTLEVVGLQVAHVEASRINLDGETHVSGRLYADGGLTVEGKPYESHQHNGVKSGPDTSGVPA